MRERASAEGRGCALAVVGGGAAGLVAAIRAAELLREAGREPGVVVVEAAREPGRKVLVSGGGRCNVLPAAEAPERFVSGSPPRLVRRFLDRVPLARQREFFEELLGAPLREEREIGKLFPPTDRARDVRDALVARCRAAGAAVSCGAPVRGVERLPDAAKGSAAGGARLRVVLDGESLDARCVLLASGGRSVLPAGADARGLEIAASLGHTLRPSYPALAPLVADKAPHAYLSGLSVPARVAAVSGEEHAEASGGFLFTHRGYSGPAALDVSHVVERALLARRTFRVSVAFGPGAAGRLPDWDAEIRRAAGTLGAFLRRNFPDRLAELLLTASGLPDTPLHRLSREARRAVVTALRGLVLPVTGTEGYRTAEVTGGGVALEEVDPGSGASKLVPGLFLAGEILDAIGPIGGFNFQWAWATGTTAGEGAARAVLAGG